MKTATRETTPRPVLTFNPEAMASLRILAGYSQAGLARKAGLSQGHMSELERGDKQPRPETIKKLAVALNVPMPALLGSTWQELGYMGEAQREQPS